MRRAALAAVLSVYFTVVTQVSHLQPDAQRAEIAVHDVQSQDTFLRGQVATSTDYSTSSYFWHILTTGLNAQSLHHSLPGICSCHFTQLYPAFDAICRKHKVEISRREHLGHALLTMPQYQFELGVESSRGRCFERRSGEVPGLRSDANLHRMYTAVWKRLKLNKAETREGGGRRRPRP